MRFSSVDGKTPLKLKALRLHIKAGTDALDRGDYLEVEDSDLDAFLDGLLPEPNGR